VAVIFVPTLSSFSVKTTPTDVWRISPVIRLWSDSAADPGSRQCRGHTCVDDKVYKTRIDLVVLILTDKTGRPTASKGVLKEIATLSRVIKEGGNHGWTYSLALAYRQRIARLDGIRVERVTPLCAVGPSIPAVAIPRTAMTSFAAYAKAV
jgi:hypothetical protein